MKFNYLDQYPNTVFIIIDKFQNQILDPLLYYLIMMFALIQFKVISFIIFITVMILMLIRFVNIAIIMRVVIIFMILIEKGGFYQ